MPSAGRPSHFSRIHHSMFGLPYSLGVDFCTCPVFLGYRLHRWPCAKAGEIDDLLPERTAQEGEPGG